MIFGGSFLTAILRQMRVSSEDSIEERDTFMWISVFWGYFGEGMIFEEIFDVDKNFLGILWKKDDFLGNLDVNENFSEHEIEEGDLWGKFLSR